MKHFANYIDIYPQSVVSAIDTDTGIVTTSDGSEPDRIYSFTNIALLEVTGNDKGNIYYKQNSRVVSNEKLSTELRNKYGNNRPVVVKFYTDNNETLILGASEIARVLIAPNLENDVLTFSRESINPVL